MEKMRNIMKSNLVYRQITFFGARLTSAVLFALFDTNYFSPDKYDLSFAAVIDRCTTAFYSESEQEISFLCLSSIQFLMKFWSLDNFRKIFFFLLHHNYHSFLFYFFDCFFGEKLYWLSFLSILPFSPENPDILWWGIFGESQVILILKTAPPLTDHQRDHCLNHFLRILFLDLNSSIFRVTLLTQFFYIIFFLRCKNNQKA